MGIYDVSEDVGDAPVTVAVLSGSLPDGVSVDVTFSTSELGSAIGKGVVRHHTELVDTNNL